MKTEAVYTPIDVGVYTLTCYELGRIEMDTLDTLS
jgi:hypothetical protein